MDKFTSENLILLEFLVDQVTLDYHVQQELKRMVAETCVCFQFLDNAQLCVCEEDFAPKKKSLATAPNEGNLKNGKSCLFSLTPRQAEEATRQFDIHVEVMKKMQPGVLPDKIVIGESLISIVNLFNELVASIADSGESPVAKTLKDCFKINNTAGELVGHISVYIRMSCFGKLIVTQFQMNLEDKSCQFKGKEGHFLFKYNKAGKRPDNHGGAFGNSGPCGNLERGFSECPHLTGGVPPGMNMNQQHMMMMQQQQMGNMPTYGMAQPGGMEGMPSGPGSVAGGGQLSAPCTECAMAHAGLAQARNALGAIPDDPNACYQEIGACMGGNALTIRVHKDKNAEMIEGSEGCYCNQGDAPQTMMNGQQGGQLGPQEFAMRPGPDNKTPISFKLTSNNAGCAPLTGGGGGVPGNVTVNSPVCTAPDGTQYTEISDPNRDVFILRIGKKHEGADKKNNLELELCTPKGPESKPIPRKETRDTQYDPLDCPTGAGGGGGGGKGKGKGGKGGKGAKGGKGGKGKGGKKGKKK